MTASRNKLAVDEKEAAKLLSLRVEEFRSLVLSGCLPGPISWGKLSRWSVSSLEAVLSGANIRDDEEFEI